jgi:flagellar hook protein FlgE
VQEGTGIPETPATAASKTFKNIKVEFLPPDKAAGKNATITIGNVGPVELSGKIKSESDMEAAIQEWVTYVTNKQNQDAANKPDPLVPAEYADVKIDFVGVGRTGDGSPNAPYAWTATLKVTATTTGADSGQYVKAITDTFKGDNLEEDTSKAVDGKTWEPSIPAIYSDELSTIKIPNDPATGLPYELDNYSISEDGTVTGVDSQNRVIPIGKVCIVSVQNPNGLEKTDGYYYKIGDNAGEVNHEAPNTSPAGYIKGSYLEMANVDLANEFSNIITTQRGFQANSKIITVTDEMLQELVSMKR